MLDSRQKRAAVIGVARAWYRNPHPSGIDAGQRASIGQVYPVALFTSVTPVTFTGTIPDITATVGDPDSTIDLGAYFTGATSYSISPAIETGWVFNTNTGELTIDGEFGLFGYYIVTGTNSGGSVNSNNFSINITYGASVAVGQQSLISTTSNQRTISTTNQNRTMTVTNTNRTL